MGEADWDKGAGVGVTLLSFGALPMVLAARADDAVVVLCCVYEECWYIYYFLCILTARH